MITIPIRNGGSRVIGLLLEPEGDGLDLEPGADYELRTPAIDASSQFEVVVNDDQVEIWLSQDKEIWKDGLRVR